MIRKSSRSEKDLARSVNAIGICLFLWCTASLNVWAVDYEGLASDQYLGEVKELCRVEDSEVFTEGPAADAYGGVYFTNVPASKILHWSPERGLRVVITESNETNGLLMGPGGTLLCCEGGAGRVTERNLIDGKYRVISSGFQGKRFAKPNDLCRDMNGRIYFTSRSSVVDPALENVKSVYRIDPDGEVSQILKWPEVHMPNGIVLSPDQSKLYLIEAHPDANHHRDIRVFDRDPESGEISNGRVLINFYPGRSGDGMTIDRKGNLYVAAGLHKTRDTSETLETRPGIHVVSPDGKLVAFRETPVDTITNCTFGGKDNRSLFITCGDRLLEIRTAIPGL